MTYRLVALMSGVLLLSLAAFGLLMAHYQDQFMHEVARTASDVGQATLRVLDVRRESDTVVEGPGTPRTGERAGRISKNVEHVVVARVAKGQDPVLVGAGEVRAETDPSVGLVLTFPRVLPATADAGSAAHEVAAPQGLLVRREEIRLPVPLVHFQELFDRARFRSLLLFFCVFIVGVTLSTGLATRFTRPIRRLDAGIKRLAAGDLDVVVQARGQDEIGRLARTFNEMAGRLRANRELEREVARREKLSALGRLAAGVAHDVRNPLHSIGLTLQHLSETARPAEESRAAEFDRAVEIIRGEIRRLDGLVTNFLQFARSGCRERALVDLKALVHDTVQLVRTEAQRRGVQIVLDLAEQAPGVLGDAEGLRSSILNLVLNGLEAMARGGRLTLALGAAAGETWLEVADTGEGIAPEDRERVFDFAWTTRDGGHGLGLAVVHHCVVEEHGGRVILDSEPGRGTRVRLCLPANPSESA